MTALTLLALAIGAVGSRPTLLDFYSEHCGPCRQMTPVIAELERRGHSVEKIDVDRQPELASRFRVESIPCLVVVAEGREVDRALGVTSIERLETMLRTAAATNGAPVAGIRPSPAGAEPLTVPAASRPRRGPLAGALAVAAPGRGRPPRGVSGRSRQSLGPADAPRLSPAEQVRPQAEPNEPLEPLAEAPAAAGPTANVATAATAEPLLLSNIESQLPLGSAGAGAPLAGDAPLAPTGDWKPSAIDAPPGQAAASTASLSDPAAQNATSPQRLLAVSVRLRIEDATGHSYGSGTIIDVRGDDALILTCGHVFRDSQGKGAVTVDMFGPGAPRGLPGEVIKYDLESDVGLISFRPGVPVAAARVAPPGSRVKAGDPVFSSGCNNGDEPTIRSSRVSSIDKYLGPPNLQVAGQPVQGRSGGGLFDADGQVIGVCNAADPADNEGLYAALPSIHKLLDNAGLAQIYQPNLAPAPSDPANLPGTMLADVRPPHMPERMPAAANPERATETSTPRELGESQPDQVAEVVCVIRSPTNPQGKNEVIILDRASPEFLRQLAIERQRQQTQSLATGRP